MNEKTNKAGATSGQKVPKSKFRHKSQQEQTAASKLRMEKRGEKLEKAKEKLAKQKPPKPPGPVRRVAGTVGGGVHGYVHGKMFEVEQDNVGTEGAHRSELVGESALRHGKRFVQKKIREHPAKAVRKAESRHITATADYHYCALPGFVDSKNEEKTERNAGYLVVSHSGGWMLRQGTRKGIRRTPANRGMRAHWV